VNADEVTEAILRQLKQSPQVVDEVTFAWREAHARTRLAYEHWRLCPGEAAYARYRAAQDQADSAQDALHAHDNRLRGPENVAGPRALAARPASRHGQ
jgi:hypothetical protein